MADLGTPAKIKAIFFDFFGVISLARHQLFFETTIPNYHKRRLELEDLGRQHDLGLITTDQYLYELSMATGMSAKQCLDQMRSQRVTNEPLLNYIKDQLKPNYKIGMISNAGGDVKEYIDKKYWSIFDTVVISCEVGVIKPDPLIFEIACQRLNVTPSQAVLVDDTQDNCDGAKSAGMVPILYTTLQDMQSEFKKIL
ncbi:MAG: HAD-IA family hydrolase [Candidatus Woesebacteria bacterium]|jgi:putative hydrolase of the HAD superfamily